MCEKQFEAEEVRKKEGLIAVRILDWQCNTSLPLVYFAILQSTERNKSTVPRSSTNKALYLGWWFVKIERGERDERTKIN